MAEVTPAPRAMYFGSGHRKRIVRLGFDCTVVGWFIKRGPTCTRIIFRSSCEQRGSTASTSIDSRLLFIPVLSRKGRFSIVLAENSVLLTTKKFPPFRISFGASIIHGIHSIKVGWFTLSEIRGSARNNRKLMLTIDIKHLGAPIGRFSKQTRNKE